MNAIELYNQLEKDFVRPGIVENWYNYECLTDVAELYAITIKREALACYVILQPK